MQHNLNTCIGAQVMYSAKLIDRIKFRSNLAGVLMWLQVTLSDTVAVVSA